ncbi:MAG TPA: polysaccharide biosynthesis tyrosine autokinase, partial [Anaerolineae bacterium]|nr:polysaccharide biosynthesis tyrosine autokinase [Anaerolineae bacterium]
VAVGTAFLIEYLDDTIKTPEDVERATHLPTLGAIAHFRRYKMEDEKGPVMVTDPRSAIAEGYRMLRTNLEFSAMGMGQSGAVILVTSAQPVEGKTTTLANLGVSLAQAGKQVLLVDTDLRRPALHKQFRLPNEVGLTSLLLEQEADLRHVIQPTHVDGLRVLTSGRLPANPAEVLSFPETTNLLERLRPLADYVLLDSPPVLSTADASILAQKVDGVCMVVETGRTRTEVFRRAAAALEGVKARLIGVALNKVVARPGGYYDYYYYTSRYSEDQDGPGKRKGRKKRPRSMFARLFRRDKRPPDDHADLRREAEPALEDRTRAEAEIAAPSGPSEAEILYTQGMAHYEHREWAQAREHFLKLKEIDPTYPDVDALLRNVDASLERTQVQPVRPVALSPPVETRSEPVAPEHPPAVKTRRSRVSRWWVAVLALVAVAVAVAGLTYYGVISLPLPIGVSNVQRYLNQGRAFFIAEDYEEAIQSFEQVLEIDPENTDAKLSLQKCKDYLRITEVYSEATALVQEGDCASAIDKLNIVIEVDPWYRDAGILLVRCQRFTDLDRLYQDAVAYHDAGQWREAAGVFEAIRAKDSTYCEMEVKSKLFACYLDDGRQRIAGADNSLDIIQANASFESALGLFPESAAAQEEKQLARLYTDGHLAHSRSSWSEAIVALSSIYHTRADYAGGRCAELLCDSCLKLGDAHRSEGRLQLALEQYRAILAIPQCEGDEAQVKEQETLLLLSEPTATPADS